VRSGKEAKVAQEEWGSQARLPAEGNWVQNFWKRSEKGKDRAGVIIFRAQYEMKMWNPLFKKSEIKYHRCYKIKIYLISSTFCLWNFLVVT
jgi:hypothetical protein